MITSIGWYIDVNEEFASAIQGEASPKGVMHKQKGEFKLMFRWPRVSAKVRGDIWIKSIAINYL